MSALKKAAIATAAVGTVAGIGYAIVRSRNRSRADEQTARAQGMASDPMLVTLPGPKTPLTEPSHPLLHKRLTHSDVIGGTVQQSPFELYTQILPFDPFTNINEVTGARLAASEHGSGSFTELACIIDAELNRAEAKRKTLYQSLTHRGTFGKQGRERPASTRLDPQMRHLLAAKAVMRGTARGVSRGATRFFDPRTMEKQHRRYADWVEGGKQGDKPAIVSCDAIGVLEAWSFDYGRNPTTGNRCPPDRSRVGKHTMAWVGPIPGVDPLRLMLMKPMNSGPAHKRRYDAARAVLERGLKKNAQEGNA